MSYNVPATPPPMRGRAYSFGQPSTVYPVTPYGGYNSLPVPYYNNNPGMSRSANYYIAPSVYGRSRSHSRPRRSHHRSSSHHHGQSRRSRSHQRPSSVRFSPSLRWPSFLPIDFLNFSKRHIATRCPRLLRLTRALPRTTPLRWARAYSTSSASGTATATSTNMVVQLTVVAGPSTNTEIRALGPMVAR
ncbi:hypothetical protein BC827DRAFT_149710 [Russula dissimulans]|nr:hypothetical protein BC827DRAFT_149710 [Russula dissimulans]